jgi:hypothetical protein
MKNRYEGLDFLRGLGIFFLVILHSAFYFFGGLYDLDLSNPPPVVTVIGLLLMFAGMFAIISGCVHGLQFMRRSDKEAVTPRQIFLPFLIRGVIIFVIAMAYFIITGPGIVDMAARSMDQSILVGLIRTGRFQGLSMERIFYVDSLVMISSNIILLGIFTAILYRILRSNIGKCFARICFISGLAFAVLSLLRIPLFSVYAAAIEDGSTPVFLLLNYLVAKNNPVLPYFSFGLFGLWIAALLRTDTGKAIFRKGLLVSVLFLVSGVFLYIRLPDTMLQREIDLKWYSIMLAQLGLFILLVFTALYLFDFKSRPIRPENPIVRFIARFGIAGLTVFFLESVISALVYRALTLVFPALSFTIPQALLFGIAMAIVWGVLLIFWERSGYRFGLEYLYGKVASLRGESSKLTRLSAHRQSLPGEDFAPPSL